MRNALILVALLALVACKPNEPRLDSGLAGYDPDLVDMQRVSCLKRGGRFGGGSADGTFVCYEPTRDGNKSCSGADDCEGLCLARSRSCAPIKPLLGCNEVLAASGAVSTICVE